MYFSIVIPVYQAEKYLERCVASVKTQSFRDWELILVDDGSLDYSSTLCDKFAAEDRRIKVIHKKNGGAASARNVGISIAKGRYLLFIDSDDYYENDTAIQQIYDTLQKYKSDVCLYGCYDEFATSGKRVQSRGNYNQQVFLDGDKGKILLSLMKSGEFPGACWIMSVNRELLQSNNIFFPVNNRAEDIDWLLSVLSVAHTFSAINSCLYVYNKNQSSSVTGTAGKQSIRNILDTVNQWSERLKQEQSGDIYLALNSYVCFEFMTTLVILGHMKTDERQQLIPLYKSVILDTKKVIGIKLKLLCCLYRVLGVRIVAIICSLR